MDLSVRYSDIISAPLTSRTAAFLACWAKLGLVHLLCCAVLAGPVQRANKKKHAASSLSLGLLS
jgi:hypothetical protein